MTFEDLQHALDRGRRLMGTLRVLAGVGLIAAGVLVAVYPEILVILLAALTISSGLGLVASGLRLRSSAGVPAGPRVIDVR